MRLAPIGARHRFVLQCRCAALRRREGVSVSCGEATQAWQAYLFYWPAGGERRWKYDLSRGEEGGGAGGARAGGSHFWRLGQASSWEPPRSRGVARRDLVSGGHALGGMMTL